MTPTHACKRGIKYRYYLSSVLLQGQSERAGSISRVPAAEIETLVISSVCKPIATATFCAPSAV
jgi:site-specific DNA recombinase